MNLIYEFDLVLKKVEDIDGAYVEIPLDIKSVFNKGRVQVIATIDYYPFEGQLVRMKTEKHILGIREELREKIHKNPGDTVHITFQEQKRYGEKAETVEEYIEDHPEEIQSILREMRQTILSCSPEIKEIISWGMPTFVYHGNLVHFSAEKKHLGFHPAPSAIEHYSEELKPYKTSKGTIRFYYNEVIPYELVRKITEFRLKENLELFEMKPKKTKREDPSI